MSKGEFITTVEEAEEAYSKELGTVYTPKQIGEAYQMPEARMPGNGEAQIDSIKMFINGLGDKNPLFRDEEYARNTKYKDVIAPGVYLNTCWVPSGTIVNPRVNNTLRSFNSGAAWEWFRPIWRGDKFTFKAISPSKVELKTSKTAGKTLHIHSRFEYTNHHGELVGIGSGYSIKAPREEIKKRATYTDVPELKITPKDLKDIQDAQDREIIRGATPRYWEDVELNEELCPVVMGPTSHVEATSWYAIFPTYATRSDKLVRNVAYFEGLGCKESLTGAPTTCINEMIERSMTNTQGWIPGAFTSGGQQAAALVFGGQRLCWQSILLTNWMGDDGFLWKMNSRYEKFHALGDTAWYKGKVTNKYIDEGKYCVDIDCFAENQRKEITQRGKATVILPSRKQGEVIYPVPRIEA